MRPGSYPNMVVTIRKLSHLVLFFALTLLVSTNIGTEGGDAFMDKIPAKAFSAAPSAAASRKVAKRTKLKLVGRWSSGPVLAVDAGEVNGVPYVFLGSYNEASSRGGVFVLNVSNPAKPTKVGEVATTGPVYDLVLSGHLLLVADFNAGLRIMDVSNPARPTELGLAPAPVCCPTDVAVSGTLALLSSGNTGVMVIDISDTTRPTTLSTFGPTGSPDLPEGVAASGSLALLTAGLSGLRVFDISDPAKPEEVGFFNTPGSANDVAVSGGLALVADGDTGLSVIDISDPIRPEEVGFFDTPGSAQGVSASGSVVLVADGNTGLSVIDISDPIRPEEVGFFDTRGNAQDVAAFGNLALVADGNAGLAIVRFPHPAFGPDLTGSWESLTQTCKGSGTKLKCSIKGKVLVQNLGAETALNSPLEFYRSNDATFDESDILLKRAAIGALKAAQTKRRPLVAKLSRGMSASDQFIIAIVDASGIIAEANETNNTIIFGPLP